MTAQDKTLRWLRMLALLYFLFAAVVVAFFISLDNSVKAPLLTLIGTASLIAVLFPALPTLTNLGAIMGTAIVMGGSGAWFLDATQGESFVEYLLFQTVVALIAFYVAITLILSIKRRKRTNPSSEQPISGAGKKVITAFVTLALAIIVTRAFKPHAKREMRDGRVG